MDESESMNVNEVKNGADSVAARPVPLFASSWIALYSFLRSSLASQGAEDSASKPPTNDQDEPTH
jgi:hypothetical protein